MEAWTRNGAFFQLTFYNILGALKYFNESSWISCISISLQCFCIGISAEPYIGASSLLEYIE